MHWVLAGVLLFAFAAPGAVVGVGFTFSRAGLLLGGACCVGVTLASCSGALLLLRLLQHFPDVKMLADIGRHTMGKAGARVGLALQMANFVLYLPVALMITAGAAQGALQPSMRSCENYFMFGVAVFCFASTQVRTMANGSLLALISLVLSAGVCALQLHVVAGAPPPPQSR